MKTCASCLAEKPLSEFKLRKGRGAGAAKLYPHSWCVACTKERVAFATKAHRERNPGYSAEHQRKRRQSAEVKSSEQKRARDAYHIDPEKPRAKARNWARENRSKIMAARAAKPEVMRAIKARYRAALLNAMPWWVSKEEIKSIFAAAHVQERDCGEKLHVDHIIPLQGESVCGLHVPWNLQIIPATINQSKGNRLPPEFN